MESFIDFFKKMFSSKTEKECYDVICEVEKEGKKELQEIRDKSIDFGKSQIQTIEDLKDILREAREIEVEKKQAEVKARVQQRIIEIKQSELARKEQEKTEKVKEIKKWLETV